MMRRRVKRALRLLLVVVCLAVVVGVLVQAFSIAAYVRGAGGGSLDLHETGGFVTHALEIVALVLALPLWWRAWRLLALAIALPVLGTLQVIAIGDTEEPGGWVNGLHGLLALVVLGLAAAMAIAAARSTVARTARPHDPGA